MRHITGESRQQSTLLPDTLDDYVGKDHPVRMIDAFVDTLYGSRFCICERLLIAKNTRSGLFFACPAFTDSYLPAVNSTAESGTE